MKRFAALVLCLPLVACQASPTTPLKSAEPSTAPSAAVATPTPAASAATTAPTAAPSAAATAKAGTPDPGLLPGTGGSLDLKFGATGTAKEQTAGFSGPTIAGGLGADKQSFSGSVNGHLTTGNVTIARALQLDLKAAPVVGTVYTASDAAAPPANAAILRYTEVSGGSATTTSQTWFAHAGTVTCTAAGAGKATFTFQGLDMEPQTGTTGSFTLDGSLTVDPATGL